MRVLFLIVARAGSKGIPGKNLKEIGGLSLIGYKARSARRSQYCTRLIISTDSPEMQEEARRHGAEAPFLRPAELASDTASSVDVMLHAMEYIETQTDESYDAVMLLEPSGPFARGCDYDAAVEMMQARSANLVVGVKPTEVHSTFIGELGEAGQITRIIDQMNMAKMRRQDFAPEYTMNGALYLARWEFLKERKALYADREHSYGYVMDECHSIEIDSLLQLRFSEFLVQSGSLDLSEWHYTD